MPAPTPLAGDLVNVALHKPVLADSALQSVDQVSTIIIDTTLSLVFPLPFHRQDSTCCPLQCCSVST